MFCVCISLILCLFHTSFSCKDNDNKYVDWWYMYKPPTDVVSFIDSNVFLYITSDTVDEFQKWTPSNKLLKNSMLQYTLAPLYDAKNHDDYAIFIYDESTKSNVSMARGILMAGHDEGIWVIHTVPELPDLTNPRAFPVREFKNGHLIACFSMDIPLINNVAALARQAQPDFRYISIPKSKRKSLPYWDFKNAFTVGHSLKFLKSRTKGQTLDIYSIVRSPGNTNCLYEAFAKNKNVILDVYGQTDKPFLSTVCTKNYSIRNIEGLSVKFLDTVFYVNHQKDHARFAVTTAAHWQKTGGSGPNNYWICISNLDKEDESAKGGIITCVNHFDAWLSFDTLKIKEPDC